MDINPQTGSPYRSKYGYKTQYGAAQGIINTGRSVSGAPSARHRKKGKSKAVKGIVGFDLDNLKVRP